MFLHVSVILFTGGLPHCMLGYRDPPGTRGRHPPSGPGTPRPLEQTSPPGTGTFPRCRHPPSAVHAGRYGQQAGGTHPTGMQSCCNYILEN